MSNWAIYRIIIRHIFKKNFIIINRGILKIPIKRVLEKTISKMYLTTE